MTAKVAAAAAACPDGKDEPENPVSWLMAGRSRLTISFTMFAIANWPTTVSSSRAGSARLGRRRYSTTPTTAAITRTPAVPPRRLMSRITLVEVSVALSAPQRAKERSHLASPEWVCTITNRKPITKAEHGDHGQADGDRQARRRRGIDVALQQHAEAGVLPNLRLDGLRALVDARCDRVQLRPASSRQEGHGAGHGGGGNDGGDYEHGPRLPPRTVGNPRRAESASRERPRYGQGRVGGNHGPCQHP